MHTKTNLFLTLLGVIALTVGCIAFGAKQAAQNNHNDRATADAMQHLPDTLPYKTIDEYLKLVGTTCPKVRGNASQNPNKNMFSYALDTIDTPDCRAARSMEDLIGNGRLFPISTYNVIKQTEQGEYKQYHKGIPVEGAEITLKGKTRTGKITWLKGTYYPALDVDTTGLISREQAARVVLRQRGVPDSLHARQVPPMMQFSSFGLLPQYNKIFYSFSFYFGNNPGTYIVNAVTGKFHSRTDLDLMHACYKCTSGDITQSIADCPSESCLSASNTATYSDFRVIVAPTLYNNCQYIRVDSCYIGDTVYYRISPHLLTPDTISYTPNDIINIFDASLVVDNNVVLREERICNKDSLSYKNTIAASLYFGMSVAKYYFDQKSLGYNSPLKILAHSPTPNLAHAGYSAIGNFFIFGDGNDDIRPLVSTDIVAHEYGHSILSKTFNINRDSTHINRHQVKAIHEGVSDIFSVLVRRYVLGTINWTIGNEIVINPIGTLPRNLAHPENTPLPQALYYDDSTNNWNPLDTAIYNHAGIIAKWFYLLANGGTGARYGLTQPLPNNPIDSIVVDSIGIENAERVLIAGLTKLDSLNTTTPTYEQFATAMADTARYIMGANCDVRKSVIKAWKAVGLLLATPDGKTADETTCFIDLQMRDNLWDTGMEPNLHSIMPGLDGIYNTGDEWEAIWESPDLWNCIDEEQCQLEQWQEPLGGMSNEIGFRIYNADPNQISEPAQLYLHFSFASTGETWPQHWNSYFPDGCLLGGMVPGCPIIIPSISPQNYHIGWFSWTPPNFFDSEAWPYYDPFFCSELEPTNFGTDSVKYEMCLLARLDAPTDPLYEADGEIGINILNSNNIVTRNTFLLDPAVGSGGGIPPLTPGHPSIILVANNNDEVRYLDILFDKFTSGSAEALYDILEISFVLSPELWDKWESTGKQGEGIEEIDTREVKITNMETAKLLNIPFNPREFQPFAIKVTILTNSGKRETLNYLHDEFGFRITHRSSDGSPINKPSNCLFMVKDLSDEVQAMQTLSETLICSPNPFSSSMNIQFYLAKDETVTLALYDLQGRLVKTVLATQNLAQGKHIFSLDSSGLASGMYICSLLTSTKRVDEKVVLVR